MNSDGDATSSRIIEPVVAKTLLLASLLAFQLLTISFLVEWPVDTAPAVYAKFAWIKYTIQFCTIASICLILLRHDQIRTYALEYRAASAHRNGTGWLIANLITFLSLVPFSVYLGPTAASHPEFATALISTFALLAFALQVSIAFALAPPHYWIGIAHRESLSLSASFIAAAGILHLSQRAQESWNSLADATLLVVAGSFRFFNAPIDIDYDGRNVQLGDFAVHIDQACSGYEGIGLVLAFSVIYLFVFRQSLRFPHALLLPLIGILFIWLLNSFRIVALILIGAHVSPDIAVGGFHSQAGWVSFLAVTAALMFSSRKLSYFRSDITSQSNKSKLRPHDWLTIAFLLPFMIFMVGNIGAAMLAPYSEAVLPIAVVAPAIALWAFRKTHIKIIEHVSWTAPIVGVAIGILWIALVSREPTQGVGHSWLNQAPVWLSILWIAARGIGTVLVVPIVEELAFRGFLYRAIISLKWEQVPLKRFSVLALLISSLAFGLLHQSIIAATVSGLAFALLMVRTGRLSDPIAAHMIANGIVFIWAAANGSWHVI